jgi:prepilin-type N-terminal cleavage/methylation domain-containing protein
MVDTMKNQKGFTLVEAVVVAVIVGTLAIVATMLYRGYIDDTQQQTVNNLAQTAAASANAYFRKTGAHPDSANLNLFLPEAGRYTVTIHSTTTPPDVAITDTKSSKTGTATY